MMKLRKSHTHKENKHDKVFCQARLQAGKEKESQSLSVVRWIIHQASGLLGLATFNPIWPVY